MSKKVCSRCFDDEDIRALIRAHGGPRGCWACGKKDAPTAPLRVVQDRIVKFVKANYRLAADELSYNSREGGYQGRTFDAYDLMIDIGPTLPRDQNGSLHAAICNALGDELWCEYDYANLTPLEALRHSWVDLCRTVKHKRRFFFHSTGEDSIDTWAPASLLAHIATQSEQINLVQNIPIGTRLWRARPDLRRGTRGVASDFGPPPAQYALQSNRMNPPGIPLLYAASSISTALRETRTNSARLGIWRVQSPLRVLDLRNLPRVPGIYSDATRSVRHTLEFLREFSQDIMQPVERNNRVNVDYLPSQVVTEFMRDYPFEKGQIDGVAYPSSVHSGGWNVALFLDDLQLGLTKPAYGSPPPIKLSFVADR